MTDEQYPKSALDKFRQWHFWWLVVFSFLLIVVFVYYLPTRFLQQAGQPHGQEEDEHMQEYMEQGMTEGEMMKHMEEDHMDGMMNGEHMMEEGEMMMPSHEEDEHLEEGHEAAYFEESNVKEGLVVNLNISPVPYNIGVPLSMDFFVNKKPGNVPILANQLQVEHEKLMHVIGVRSDMNEFFHIHPEFLADNPSIFSVDHVFKKPGLYKIWSEVKKDGTNYSFGHPEVNVNGAGPLEEKNVSFSRNIIIGNYQVSMETSDTLTKGREVDLSFDIHSLTGMEIEVEQYLGADMHLSIIRDDLKQFIHIHPVRSHAHAKGASPKDLGGATSYGTHPNDGSHSSKEMISTVYAHSGTEDEPAGATDEHQTSSSGDEVISFHVTFLEAGLYKAFAQFRPKGIDLPTDQALLAEFWIQVEEKAALPISQWWILLFVSVMLIAGLSWWVNWYLKVKPEDITVKKN